MFLEQWNLTLISFIKAPKKNAGVGAVGVLIQSNKLWIIKIEHSMSVWCFFFRGMQMRKINMIFPPKNEVYRIGFTDTCYINGVLGRITLLPNNTNTGRITIDVASDV